MFKCFIKSRRLQLYIPILIALLSTNIASPTSSHALNPQRTGNAREDIKAALINLITATPSKIDNTATLSNPELGCKYPKNDELTEKTTLLAFPGGEEVAVSGYGYWFTTYDYVYPDPDIKYKGQRSISAIRFGGFILPLALFFEFSGTFDASNWNGICFWYMRNSQCENYTFIALIDENIKFADYYWENLPNDQWIWLSASFNDSLWCIDEGFNWQKIKYLVFATDAFSSEEYLTIAWMHIDEPMFYAIRGSGLVDYADVSSSNTKIYGELFVDTQEYISDADFWAVRITVEKLVADLLPFYIEVRLEMPPECEEFPANHVPQSGEYGRSRASYSFSYHGIGFSVALPLYVVTYERQTDTKTRIKWQVSPSMYSLIATCEGPVMADYCQFAVGFKVPEGFKPYVQAQVSIAYYKDYGITKRVHSAETLSLMVDPPGVGEIPPMNPPTFNPPQELKTVKINSFRIFSPHNESHNTTKILKDGFGVWLNITFGLKNTQAMVGVELYDKNNRLVSGIWVLASAWCYGTSTCTVYNSIANFAALGQGTLRIMLKTNWAWQENCNFIPEYHIPIEIIDVR